MMGASFVMSVQTTQFFLVHSIYILPVYDGEKGRGKVGTRVTNWRETEKIVTLKSNCIVKLGITRTERVRRKEFIRWEG